MADALAHAHARGVVHRDVKSPNVVVTPEGQVKVLDFGSARRLTGEELTDVTTVTRQELTAPGMVAGTLAYMAPEQLRGRPADARSDIWALGVVLYESAAGARPFRGGTGFELSSAVLHQAPPPLPPAVPAPLVAVIERCLAKEPARRYQRAGEVRAALRLQPDSFVARNALSQALFLKGMYNEALAADRERLAGDREIVAALERGAAEAGYAGAQRRMVEVWSKRFGKPGGVSAVDLAVRCLHGGDRVRAIEWLERAYQDREANIPYIGMPIYDVLRPDLRYQNLLRRVGLPR